MAIRRALVFSLFTCVALCGSALVAGIITGRIASIDQTDRKVTLEPKDKKKSKQSFEIPSKLPITLDGKNAKLKDLAEGQQASVFTDSSNNVTRLTARTEAAGGGAGEPAERPTTSKKTGASKKTAGKRAKTEGAGGEGDTAGADWPQFLGPNRDNISTEAGLKKRWSGSPKLLWTARGLGEGYSSVSVARGQIFTMGNVGGDEMVMSLKLDGGNGLWQVRSGAPFREGQGNGPRSVPTVDGELVYSLGASGDLTCLVAASGEIRWRKNILTEFGGNNIQWGICESVLIDGDRLICTPGGNGATVVALNKQTGNMIWKAAAGGPAGYASAIATDVGGVRQYVQFTSGGTIGVRAEDGQVLWKDQNSANGTANCSSPVAFGDAVFTASGYGTGGALLHLRSRNGETQASFAWGTKDMKNHHGGMIVLDGFLYGSNDPGILTCIDLKSGKVRWQNRSVGKASLAYVDGNLIVRSEDGPMALVAAVPTAYNELGRFEPTDRSGRKTWPYPVVSHGKLFLRDQDTLQCYDLR